MEHIWDECQPDRLCLHLEYRRWADLSLRELAVGFLTQLESRWLSQSDSVSQVGVTQKRILLYNNLLCVIGKIKRLDILIRGRSSPFEFC